MNTARDLAAGVGKARACQVLDLPRSSFYRAEQPKKPRQPRPRPPRALSSEEQGQVLGLLRSPRFVDCAPISVWATLLDEGVYHCSARTMYRLLAAHGEVRERRDQLRHPTYEKPELLAEKPNQVWTWDITELRGPVKYQRFYLYAVLDLYSRYVVGWMVAEVQSHKLAQHLIGQALEREGISRDQLTIHSDRGATMLAKPLGFMLADLGIIKSHSRPHCCNDNPFVESHFRTLKYRPEFPNRFGSLIDARQFCGRFFDWYHHQHRHSGLGWMTPHSVHHGQADQIRQQRQDVLNAVYEKQPERFVRQPPQAPAVPSAVWINPPKTPLAGGATQSGQGAVLEVANQELAASSNLTPQESASTLACPLFFQGDRVDETLLEDATIVGVDHSLPPFGLELNNERKLSQSH